MSENLTPEEVDALHEDAGNTPDPVEKRDFRHPRRWGQLHREALKQRVKSGLSQLEDRLQPWSPETLEVGIESIDEVETSVLIQSLEEPFLVLGFEMQGAPGWILWDRDAALANFKAMFTGSDEDDENDEDEAEDEEAEEDAEASASPLSPMQSAMVHEFLSLFGTFFGELFELPPENLTLHQTFSTLLEKPPVGDLQDRQRTCFRLSLVTAGGPSEVSIYVPGLEPEEEEAKVARTLPDRLSRLTLELRATLADVEVPLGELLNVQVGDVIPLRCREGSPLSITVQGRPCGKATWGVSDGSSALRLQEFGIPAEEQ